MTESLKGRLLVATPGLIDLNFARTVVLLVEHSGEGAAGVVLNRPSRLPVEEPLPAWARLAAEPPVVFVGGPVRPEGVVCLARARGEPPVAGWQLVLAGIGALDLSLPADELQPRVSQVRLFSGFAGWDSGQLEGEMAEGAWFAVDAEPEDVLSASPERLWSDVLKRQRGGLALYANYPPDPTLN